MIFINNLTKITDTKYSIGYQHNMPFDVADGLGKTEEELLQDGKLVELPVRLTHMDGKDLVMYYNPIDNFCFWEYVDILKEETEIEKIKMDLINVQDAINIILGL